MHHPSPATARLSGIWLPLITPFVDGMLDDASLARLAAYYAAFHLPPRLVGSNDPDRYFHLALARIVAQFGEATGTPSQFVVSGEPTPLGAEAQLAVYRTTQEALTNIRKHAASPSSVSVCLCYAPEGTELLVDDMAVASPSNGAVTAGYGLVGMRERAALVGGSLEAGPTPYGFRVRLWLPRT